MKLKILGAVASVVALREQLVNINAREMEILNAAEAEGRDLTDEETAELGELKAAFEKTEANIKRREEIEARQTALATPEPRVARPAASGRITGGEATEAAKRTFGFNHLGEFMMSVRAAAKGNIDRRLMAAATTYGNESTDADGGYAVPPDFRAQIAKKIGAEESLLARTDQQFTSSNKLTVPTDETTPWQTSGGILVYWPSEAVAITQSKPAVGSLEVPLHKATALVPLTDELIEDVAALSSYLPGKVGDKFVSSLNDKIVNGDGTGELAGLMASGSKITVAKEVGQAAATVVYANIAKMWSRMYAPLRAGAVWLVNQDIEPQLLNLVAPGSNFPAYLGPNGLSASPFGTLLGRPVIPVETCETLGTEGDIILTNLSAYLTAQKVGGGMKQDVSMHLFFDQNITAFRFVMRVGGKSWLSSAITRQKGSNTLSNIVTLATRA